MGRSAVVVSGGAYKASKAGYYYEFIESALFQLKEWKNSLGKKYWFIAKRGWSKSDTKAFKKQAKKWFNRFGGATIAFEGKTDYSEINYFPGRGWLYMRSYEWKHSLRVDYV